MWWFKNEIIRIFSCVWTKYINSLGTWWSCIYCSKILTTIWIFNNFAIFKWYFFVWFYLITSINNIHYFKLVIETSNQMKTWRVNCYGICFFLKISLYFNCFFYIIPYTNNFIWTTCHNQWFAHTYIHACDRSIMEF